MEEVAAELGLGGWVGFLPATGRQERDMAEAKDRRNRNREARKQGLLREASGLVPEPWLCGSRQRDMEEGTGRDNGGRRKEPQGPHVMRVP